MIRNQQKIINMVTPNQIHDSASSLFKQIMSGEKIKSYLSLQPDKLKPVCRQSGRLFHRKLSKKPNQILAFLSNYHHIILGYTDKIANQIINNISLHFLLLSSYAMLENNQKKSAKDLLKKSLNYIDSTQPDAILLTTALNNLCILWIQDKKYYKAVNVLLQMVKIMEEHMKMLKHSKNKGQMMQDSVFLVHSYYLLTKCLAKIKVKNHQNFYQELYHYSCEKGVAKAIKYLGNQSFLTKKYLLLTQNNTQLQLPIFKQPATDRSTIQQKLLKKLENIQNILNSPREPTIIKQIIKQSPPPPPPQPVAFVPSSTQEIVCKCSRIINNWLVEIQIIKEKGQKMGNVVIQCNKKNSGQFVNLIINQQRMLKLWSQMHIKDVLPPQHSLTNLSPKQLIQYCIFNFLHIDSNKNIQIFPRSHYFLLTLIYSSIILQKQMIIFLYHINKNNFRIVFGIKENPINYYLELEMSFQWMEENIQLQEEVDKKIYQIYDQVMKNKNRDNNMKFVQLKKINVKNQQKLIALVTSIMKKLQIFLKNVKPDATKDNIFQAQLEFYKFVQLTQKKDYENGKFYCIRYLNNIKGYQTNVENTYQTHGPQGKIRAKGQILYSYFQFFRDFGIASQHSLAYFRAFCSIISKKYSIKSYQNPLSSHDLQIYQQNSISQIKITFKTYLRTQKPHKFYIFPITACLISINNQIPVGIKVTGYNPTTCFQVGYFIHTGSDWNWRWVQKMQEIQQDFVNNVVQQYAYKREYFIVDWLENWGFRKILEFFDIDQKDNFYYKGKEAGNFFRISNIIQMIQ